VYGFFFIAICFVAMAALFKPLSHGHLENTNALFAVYCILLFSLSWGPNLTTYILPAQTYPKEVRATFNGISAACGKLGAFTGVYVFSSMAVATSYATGTVLYLTAAAFVCGADSGKLCGKVALELF
jgi:nitrate/nitrite transporter NarK